MKISIKNLIGSTLLLLSTQSYAVNYIDVLAVTDSFSSGHINQLVKYINYTNTSLTNTQLDYQLRIVGMKEGISSEITQLTHVERIEALANDTYNTEYYRQLVGADVVVMIDEHSSTASGCGRAYGLDRQWIHYSDYAVMSMSGESSSCADHIFAHEFGHILGGAHEDDSAGQYDDEARGYKDQNVATATSVIYYTTELHLATPVYSSKDITYNGKKIGDATHDMRTTMLETLPIIGGHFNEVVTGTTYSTVPESSSDVLTEVEEGHGLTNNAYFYLEISSPLTQDVSVRCATRDGTAKRYVDYVPIDTRCTISTGETSMVIEIPVIGDFESEGNETFELVLTDPQGAKFPDGITELTATRTIVDDD